MLGLPGMWIMQDELYEIILCFLFDCIYLKQVPFYITCLDTFWNEYIMTEFSFVGELILWEQKTIRVGIWIMLLAFHRFSVLF